MKPLLIGEAPSKNEPLPRPIEGRIGRRLAWCCGLSLEGFLKHFDCVNLLKVRQDTKEKGFEFDHKAARVEAARLRRTFQLGQRVLLLGRRVAKAFNLNDREYFECTLTYDLVYIYVLPHPSGVSRWWNSPENRATAELFMRTIVEKTRREYV